MIETILSDGLFFEIRRSDRRKTMCMTVDRGSELVVHAPRKTPSDELEQWIRLKLLWVHHKLNLKNEIAGTAREPEYVRGESFSYLGKPHTLMIAVRQAKPLLFDKSLFHLRADSRDSGAQNFKTWFTDIGKKWIASRVKFLSRKVRTSPVRIEVRDLGYRWGSCGRNKVIYFNWKLMQLPVRLIDYVIIHEMVHLTQPHHGPAFWKTLDSVLPDWRERQEELKMGASNIYWCHEIMAP
ncbi:MAG TPA: metal-dependent hydrolase [Lentisphaeria bacterium]|nr:MAG: metal-dependent hydrolase [Lentisphaerae bacterium GWF2_49_21]HBC86482.1 metal-dependent hydrolase [Lentisphaeria bacterium]